ncbi:MAG: discoidin domain-containing protein [Planctomycetes bacterium]|nr:discoidin domain-containing protein [Planctomycetota bacterium]
MCQRLICLTSVLLLAGAAIVSAATPGPVGWWKFDETSGTTAIDSAGGRNGSLLPPDPNGKGLGPKWVAGKFGGAVELDGSNDYVELPIGDLINTLESTTFAVWVNWAGSSTGSWQRIFDFGSGTSVYAFLAANRSGTQSPRFAMRSATVGEQVVTAPAALGTGWHHLAVAIDSATMTMQMYLDGDLVRSAATTILPKAMGVTTQNWIARSQYPADAYYKGDVDDLRLYDRALSQDEVANTMQGGVGFGVATTPSPANKAVNLLPDVSLRWKSGQLGQTHDIYFGTDFNSVANAATAAGLGVLVSPGQTATTYNAGRLKFGTTYYWRVDEVGAAPDFAVVKGNVWSFTVEPVGYPIGKASITATAASSNSTDMGPEKTIDGSGLNAGGQHSTKETDMWLSAKAGPQPTWIQYAFDKVYSLNDMLVWNSNQALEAVVGYGAKSVTVEYSVDGANWSALGEFEFAQAPGEDTYTANTTVDFGGVAAKFVKLTMNSNWGGLLPQYGLSEVRLSYIPVAATNPSPASGTVELEGPVALSWRPGREAAAHEIYFGTDKANLPLVATVFKTSFEAAVELDKTYYWQVIEVNEAKPTVRWPSDIWTFKTKELPKDAGAANLVALYNMEDNIDDSSGSGLSGTLTNGPVFIDSTAGMGKALSFDGTDDYATLPIGNLLSTLSDTTIAMWANYSGSGGAWQRMFDFGSGTTAYLFLTPNMASNQMRVALRSTTVGEQLITDGALPTGWHHVAVTIDSATMTMKLYLDGNLKGSGTTGLLPKDMGVTTQNWLAKSQYSADAYYKGALDDFRIYNKALSKGEVMYLAGLR